MGDEEHNGWNEWKNKVLSDLKYLRADMKEMRGDITTLKVKSGMWGVAGASIAVAAMTLMKKLF